MIWLHPRCSEPHIPVAECVLHASSRFALQFVLQDLKIAQATTPSVRPLFVLYCTVYHKIVWAGQMDANNWFAAMS